MRPRWPFVLCKLGIYVRVTSLLDDLLILVLTIDILGLIPTLAPARATFAKSTVVDLWLRLGKIASSVDHEGVIGVFEFC